MTIPAVIQGTVEVEGKVFELDSPKGAAWLETIGSFRFEPAGNSKPYTVRREPSGYWYGCRKISGKVRKKYIGKSSDVSIAKLEEIAEALEVPPVPRVNKVAEALEVPPVPRVNKVAEVAQEVAEVAQEVAEVAQEVAEVAQDRLTALELEVAMLRQAVQALQEALPGKSEAGDSEELPKVDSEVAEELQNELSNLPPEPEHIEFLKRLVAKKDPLISSDLWQEIERLKERNRQLRLKIGAERRESIEKISDLEDWNKGLTRRVQEKQARLDELEAQLEQARNDYASLLESSTYVTNKLRDETQGLRSQLEQERADREKLQKEFNELNERHLARVFVAEALQNEKSATASKDLPEAADLYNQLKTRRKKSSASLADVELILEMIEES
jgi:DNA repair exonuclease SbcCD ATPase subunit